VKRREFIAGLGAAVWPMVARAQQGDRVRRIGVLVAFDETTLWESLSAPRSRKRLRTWVGPTCGWKVDFAIRSATLPMFLSPRSRR
jgi:hypothetical protein